MSRSVKFLVRRFRLATARLDRSQRLPLLLPCRSYCYLFTFSLIFPRPPRSVHKFTETKDARCNGVLPIDLSFVYSKADKCIASGTVIFMFSRERALQVSSCRRTCNLVFIVNGFRGRCKFGRPGNCVSLSYAPVNSWKRGEIDLHGSHC